MPERKRHNNTAIVKPAGDAEGVQLQRSYVLRGRMTTAQKYALRTYGSRFILPVDQPFSRQRVFDRSAPLCIEIGFGMGENLVHMAKSYPGSDFIGIDVHAPGAGKVIRECVADGVSNLRVYKHDVIEVLTHCFPKPVIDYCFILFPDPWPKSRHHKRRLIQQHFINVLHSVLTATGRVQVVTDWQNYAKQIAEVFSGHTGWLSCDSTAMPYQRIETRYERKGRKSGRMIDDFVWQKS